MIDRLPISDAALRLLPSEIVANLTRGDKIKTSGSKNGISPPEPFFYTDDLVSAVAGYILGHDSMYSSPAFRENVRQYLKRYGFASELPVLSRPTQTDVVPMRNRGLQDDRFIPDTEVPHDPRHPWIFMHGRFNGFPHPGYIETLHLMKEIYPQHRVVCGIDVDDTSTRKGQLPFMDVQLRATLLNRTGVIDQLVLLNPPPSRIEEYGDGAFNYWLNLFDPEAGYRPVIVLGNDELRVLKLEEMSIFNKVFTTDELDKQVEDLHQTDIKEGNISAIEVARHWQSLDRFDR